MKALQLVALSGSTCCVSMSKGKTRQGSRQVRQLNRKYLTPGATCALWEEQQCCRPPDRSASWRWGWFWNTQLNHLCASCWPGAIAQRFIKDCSVLLLLSRQQLSDTDYVQKAAIDHWSTLLSSTPGCKTEFLNYKLVWCPLHFCLGGGLSINLSNIFHLNTKTTQLQREIFINTSLNVGMISTCIIKFWRRQTTIK